MKKIGIVTYINLNNYGSVLQATALAEFLSSKGYGVDIIDIDSKVLIHRLEPSVFNRNFLVFLRNLLVRVKHPIYFSRWLKRRKIFSRYRKSLTYLTSRKYDYKSLRGLEEKYDCFISGGDQVWNLYNTDGDARFMLDFVHDSKKMKSFSASLGRTFINEKYLDKAVNQIRKFSSVLVREEQSALLLKENFNIDASYVLDPVFLLSEEQWFKYEDQTFKDTDYVLFYSIANCPDYLNAAKEYSASNNQKLFVINSGFVNFAGSGFTIKTPSPNMFLSYFKNASSAIVASFHGVAFCIIYHLDFVCFNFIGDKDIRILNLLKICGLEDRLIIDPNSNIKLKHIDWEKVDDMLNKKKNLDISLLMESLNDI